MSHIQNITLVMLDICKLSANIKHKLYLCAMIIDFKIENYASFKDSNKFSMVTVPSYKEFEKENVFNNAEGLKLLKTAAIFGNNASGKSSFIWALSFMKSFIRNSFRDSMLDETNRIGVMPFLLSTSTENQPSLFEINFIHEKTKYRYGFEVDNEKVYKEWLYKTTSREVELFFRDESKIENERYKINGSSFKEGVGLVHMTKNNVLFLSLVSQFNGKISNSILKFFMNINVISGVTDDHCKNYTLQKVKDNEDFRKWLTLFLRSLEITSISHISDDEINIEKSSKSNLSDAKKRKNAKEEKEDELMKLHIFTWHNYFNENNVLVGSKPLHMEAVESEGTKKLFYLLGAFYDTLRNGKLLVIDELDSRFHPLLTIELIKLFHETNKLGAQLIFTSHDVNILDENFLRRDQIWFTEKNQFGVSSIYSLSDFKTSEVRNTSAFAKNYLRGRYGAISNFSLNDKIINTLYGKETTQKREKK